MPTHGKMQSVLERTVRRLEEKVLEGSWGDNTRLPSERSLAEILQVARSTVREAIQRLVSKGLLETRPGSGLYVVQRQPARLSAPWLQLIVENPPLRAETLEFRLVFECAAARFAAQRSTPAERDTIGAIVTRMHAAVDARDVDAEASLDAEFHMALTGASHNRMLDQFYASVITLLREHISRNTYDAAANNENAGWQSMMRLKQHESIYDAIRAGNGDAAQQAMFAHIDFVGRQFEPRRGS
ncbi:MAG: FadR/GntR family transcriptional regulator [Janthinobacterium lividum]